jgi:hypothetical protein
MRQSELRQRPQSARVSGYRAELRHRPQLLVEFGRNDLAAFSFAVLVTTIRRDVVAVAHDPPKLAHAPGAGLIRRGALKRVAVHPEERDCLGQAAADRTVALFGWDRFGSVIQQGLELARS